MIEPLPQHARGFVSRLLVALGIAEVAAAFETSMIYASIKKLNIAFGDPVAVGWLVTAYMLVGADWFPCLWG